MRFVRAVVMKCEGLMEVWTESGREEKGMDRIELNRKIDRN